MSAGPADHPRHAAAGSGGATRPLTGRTVVVTRPREQAAAFAGRLEALGARVLVAPTIRIVPVEPDDEARDCVARLPSYSLTIFTSVNAVLEFAALVFAGGASLSDLAATRVVAIGPVTAAALAEMDVRVDLTPERAVAESLVEALSTSGLDLAGARVLFPRAREAREIIPDALRAAGAEVDLLTVYETVAADDLGFEPARIAAADAITFTAASTVDQFVTLMSRAYADAGAPEADLATRLASARLCSIGPVTSDALRRHGLTVAAEADPHTTDGLVAALVGALA